MRFIAFATSLILASTLSLAASPKLRALPEAKTFAPLLQGRYDNRHQVDSAPKNVERPLPRVVVTIEPTPQAGWTLWRVHIETDPSTMFDQTWAVQARIEYDGSLALIPYYQLHQDSPPAAAAFDTHGWLSLEACALRGPSTLRRIQGMAEGEPCVAVSIGIGGRRALLPVAIALERDRLQVDFNLSSTRTRIDAERVE